jgi:hypothetical protein
MATDPTVVPVPAPPASPTQDDTAHNTSPVQAAAPQKPIAPVKIKPAREITGTIRKFELPDHVTKHPNYVGRPKIHRGV